MRSQDSANQAEERGPDWKHLRQEVVGQRGGCHLPGGGGERGWGGGGGAGAGGGGRGGPRLGAPGRHGRATLEGPAGGQDKSG